MLFQPVAQSEPIALRLLTRIVDRMRLPVVIAAVPHVVVAAPLNGHFPALDLDHEDTVSTQFQTPRAALAFAIDRANGDGYAVTEVVTFQTEVWIVLTPRNEPVKLGN